MHCRFVSWLAAVVAAAPLAAAARVVAAAAVAALLAAAAPASASAPSVFVRIEGAGATLLPQTLVHTTNAPTVRGHSCPGSSAAGALNVATRGRWQGTFEKGSGFADFFVTGILGERPAGNNFWTLWQNGRSSSTGECETHLHQGDHELWFDCLADSSFNCTNNPLRVSLPTVARLGRPLTASVVQLDGAGHSSPMRGAVLSGKGIVGVSRAGGKTRITPRRAGLIAVHASKSGATPSDPVLICIYRQARSECASAEKGPSVHIGGISDGERFVTGPRQLHGTVGPAPAGLLDVSLGLKRRALNGGCSYLDGTTGSWRTIDCRRGARRFSLGASSRWSYLLPARLAAGSYHLRVVATDGEGRKGQSAVEFSVR